MNSKILSHLQKKHILLITMPTKVPIVHIQFCEGRGGMEREFFHTAFVRSVVAVAGFTRVTGCKHNRKVTFHVSALAFAYALW